MADIPAYGASHIVVTRPNGAEFDLGEAQDAATCWIETKDIDLGDPHVFKLLRAFDLLMSTPGYFSNLQLIVRTRNDIRQPFRDWIIDADNVDETLKKRIRNCKFFRLRLQDNGVQARWHLTQINIYGAVAGRRL